MKLYHGTATYYLRSILKEGLAPPFEDVEVSLTDDYENAVSYATDAAERTGSNPVVLTVKVRHPKSLGGDYSAEYYVQHVSVENIVRVEHIKPLSKQARTEVLQRLIDERGE